MDLPKLSYRPEIDGLRAIAVVSVIFYHAQIVLFGRHWFEGGFIGVDIFFVISGYLITRIILSELESKGSFSFINFYERRARRILPMLFVVIFTSVPYAWQKLLPSAFVEYTESILASLFFGSNFFFYFNTTEYGADSALLKPFLHTWSLGVEEQFYLVFPILAIVAFKYFHKQFLTILVGLSLLSLLFSELMEVRNSDLNFYLPFGRFWELAVGSMLAYRALNYKSSNEGLASKSLPMIGLCLIAQSILFFDSTTPHPSFHTLIPIIGVTLIIEFASKDELVGKVLGSKPFVWLGLISYSAYLWHFPIFAFSRMSKEPTNYDKFEWIVLTLILSVLSYFFVEKPFRLKKLSTKIFVRLLAAGGFTLSIFCTVSIISTGFSDFRYPNGIIQINLDKRSLKSEHWSLIDENIEMVSSPNINKWNVLVVGNSHAVDFFDALFLAKEHYRNYHFMKLRQYDQLHCFNETDGRYSNWRRNFYESDAYQSADILVVATRYKNAKCNKKHKGGMEALDFDGLDFLLNRVKSDGKKLIIVNNKAEIGSIDGRIVSDYFYLKYSSENKLGYENFKALKDQAELEAFNLVSQEKLSLNLKLKEFCEANRLSCFDRFPTMCSNEYKRCAVFDDKGFKIRYDYGHLTKNGKKFVSEKLIELDFLSLLHKVRGS